MKRAASGALWSVLKWAAVASMVCDHVNVVLGRPSLAASVAGRFAFPLFALGVGLVVHHLSRHPARYVALLVALGVVSEPAHRYFTGTDMPLNIGFTLGLGAALAIAWGPDRDAFGDWRRRLRWATPVLLVGALWVEYWIPGVLIPLVVALLANRGWWAVGLGAAVLAIAGNWGHQTAWHLVLSFPLLLWATHRWGGRLPRGPRLFWYAFYPVHMWILRVLVPLG